MQQVRLLILASIPSEPVPMLTAPTTDHLYSFLDETAHVEVFESAHSVILAILSTPLDASTKGSIPAAVRAFNKNLVHSYLATLLRVRVCSTSHTSGASC